MKLRPMPRKGRATAFDAPQRLRERCDRVRRIARIQTHEVSRAADRDAVIVEPHQPRRQK